MNCKPAVPPPKGGITEADKIAKAIESVAYGLIALGTNNAATPMGAIEAHMVAVEQGAESLASAIQSAGCEIADGLRALARAIEKHGEEYST